MRPEIDKWVTDNAPWHDTLSGCLATDTKIEREIRAFQWCIMQDNQSETRKVFQV
jgi:hypothetical protein